MDLQELLDALEAATTSLEQKNNEITELQTKGISLSQTHSAEVEALKKQIAELDEQLADIQVKGHYTMDIKEKAFDLNATVKSLIKSAAPQENIFTKGVTTEAGSAGETIQTQYAPAIVKPLKERSAFLSRIGSRTVLSEDVKRFVKTGASETRWAGENVTNGNVSNTGNHGYATVTGTFGKVEAYPFITGEALNDSQYDIMADLAEDVIAEIGDTVAAAALNGDGVNKPKGLLKHVGGAAHASFEEIVALNEVDALRKVVASLKSGYRANAAWLMSEADFVEIQELKDANGRHYVQYEITDAATPRLFGFPILIEYGLPVGTRLFGDFERGFELLTVQAMQVMPNPYAVPGNIQVYHALRVGTMVKDVQAVKIVKKA